MKVGVVGAGYVGLIQGVGLAEKGHEVTIIDVDKHKVKKINEGTPPFHEPGLKKALNSVKLRASTDYASLKDCEVVFLCVGTPPKDDGSANLKHVFSAAKSVKEHLGGGVVCVKSTVVPGTTERVGELLGGNFSVAHNPEFLREGSALSDFRSPDRVVMGGDEEALNVLEKVYQNFDCPKVKVTVRASEMIKYASNALLATKISFANEVANICQLLGVDASEVWRGVGLDSRINPRFLGHGVGFGGSCFPKDVQALRKAAESRGYDAQLLDSVLKINDEQPKKMIELLKSMLPDLKGRRVGVLGLAFKPGTSDLREARSLKVINILLEAGAEVLAFDPRAVSEAKKVLGDSVSYAGSVREVLDNVDAALVVTEWDVIKNHDYSGFDKPLVDGRGVSKPNRFYRRIGKPF